MTARFSVLEDGSLVADNGRVLGRLVSFEIELANSDAETDAQSDPSPRVRARPRAFGPCMSTSTATSKTNSEETRKKFANENDPTIATVWAHYIRTFDSKAQLNPQRRRVIEQALKIASVTECCEAITGLSRSPHHNGQNDQGIKYLDIRYALKGNGVRGESTEERIAKMAQLASLPALETPEQQSANERQRRLDRELAKLEEFPDSELRPGDIARRDELRALRAESAL